MLPRILLVASIGLSPAERAALVRLYQTTDGAHWAKNRGWLAPGAEPQQCPDWEGINDCKGGRPKLRFESGRFAGTLPTELGALTSITWLRIHGSPALSGTLPTQIGLMTSLTSLELVGSPRMTGTLPTELGRMRELASMVVAPCERGGAAACKERLGLSGTLPSQLRLRTLRSLEILQGRLSGTLPDTIALADRIALDGNSLSGSVPQAALSSATLQSLTIGSVSVPSTLG
jgi:hypothetical protein